MVLFLLLVALLLSPTGEAGKIIGGHEAKPHSRPYMAFLRFKISGKPHICGGFLVREDFVLTAAHCLGSSIDVTLGAHNIREQERTQQVIPVWRTFPHPYYNMTGVNDIMLLQGDSGGPLVCNGVAQGIVSYGKEDGTPPRVFTRISSFLPWIQTTMKQYELQGPD
ncbi:mast cell protease 3-like isoform X1 [Dama dama]|uniref:mast cell protease 3-like isoform X1 n=1 Tax=Dama dama TaxID=30532 RepID=UPI002A36BCC7|nr:mast cell protease 3-like isoform X1 [Dama dama]